MSGVPGAMPICSAIHFAFSATVGAAGAPNAAVVAGAALASGGAGAGAAEVPWEAGAAAVVAGAGAGAAAVVKTGCGAAVVAAVAGVVACAGVVAADATARDANSAAVQARITVCSKAQKQNSQNANSSQGWPEPSQSNRRPACRAP